MGRGARFDVAGSGTSRYLRQLGRFVCHFICLYAVSRTKLCMNFFLPKLGLGPVLKVILFWR